jgi:hypothetical protein
MGTYKLYLFAKNTDANASIRGYNYQTLKTVETWLYNSINDIDDEIYCDYEDDIFQRNEKKVKFRQLKLYSSNFSFKSEEIEKCIIHFFLLHVKTEYSSVKKEFVFEANSRIANSYLDNDAELLREWYKNQNALSEDLLVKCREKVKSIVTKYTAERANELKEKVNAKLLSQATAALGNMKDSHWDTFAKMIRWRFLDTSPDEEFARTITRIENQILEHRIPIGKDNMQSAFGVLYKSASLKASAIKIEDRKLTNALLEKSLLKISGEEDKVYSEVYEKWESFKSIDRFNIGEFYEVLNATRFCRRSSYLTGHDNIWLPILTAYNSLPISLDFKRKAVYEYLWLKFRPDDNFKLPTGSLKGSETLVSWYFEDFNSFHDAEELEDAQSLLHIVFTAFMCKKVDLELKQLINWFKGLYRVLNSRLKGTDNPNEKCYLLEELGIFKMFTSQRKRVQYGPLEFIRYFEQILTIIDDADLYHASVLADRINQYIKLFIKVDPEKNENVISALEDFSDKLDVQVQKREGKYKKAKQQVERGSSYIYTNNPKLLLKALHYFHEAKDLFNHKETIEGYILALINISQLYSVIGMNLAAKYYSLSAVWVSIHNGDEKMYKRIADASAMLFHADFRQGSWFNALQDFQFYFNARHQFDTSPIVGAKDSMLLKSVADFATILHSSPMLSSELTSVVDSIKSQLGFFGDEFVHPALNYLEKEYPDKEAIVDLLDKKLVDNPCNDCGPVRYIRFNALGCDWEINFANSYEMTSIGEEFVAILQIMLTEIFLLGADFHFPKSKVFIELERSATSKAPEPLPSNTEYRWRVFLTYFDIPKPAKINEHMAIVSSSMYSILNEISLLPSKEFQTTFVQLFTKGSLAKKAMTSNSYQRIYRYLLPHAFFEKLDAKSFSAFIVEGLAFPKENVVMPWRSDLSQKYDKVKAIEYIKNRFKNLNPCIYITLGKLKPDSAFRDYVNELRAEGWLDWHIALAMMNFMVNYKASLKARGRKFSSDYERGEFQKEEMLKLVDVDEKDCYVLFPLEAFKSEEFRIQLHHFPIYVLRTNGLEYKGRFPNFDAVSHFLNVRFNMKTDTTNDGNPISDI